MSITVRELLDSRSVAKKSGKLSARRSFHVYDAATPIQTPARIAASFGANGLPAFGEEFPEAPGLIARDYDLALVSGHNDLWLVTWDYSEIEPGGGISIPEKEPGQPGYIEVSASVSASRFPAWRILSESDISALVRSSGTNPGPYPNGDAITPADIGGTAADVNGEPINDVVKQLEITITELRNGMPDLSDLLGFIWTRNASRFLGAPVGSLLYQGCAVNRVDVNLFSYQHKFGYDRWYWMRQVPIRNAMGDVVPKPIPIVPGPGLPPYNVADTVFFVQGFPDKTDFFNISPRFRSVA